MAISNVQSVTHLSFGERPEYGQPYPDGIAVARQDVVGDVSGGAITFNVNAPPGFLYRYEMIRGNITVDVAEDWELTVIHAWATDRTDLGAGAFNTFHKMFRSNQPSGIVELEPDIGGGRYEVLHRFLIGSVAAGVDQLIAQIRVPTNTNLRVYNLISVFTYWRKSALYLPGFLSSFYEAPAIPGLLRPQT